MKLSRAAWPLLWAGIVLAQPEPGAPPSQSQEPETARSEYTGPAILSRGWSGLSGRVSEHLRLRPFASLRGAYDTGLTPVSVNEAGELLEHHSYGAEADFGVTGDHPYRRGLLGLQYRGRLRHYRHRTYYDGFDNFLTLNLVHRASRRIVVELTPTVASYSRGFFLPEAGSAYYSSDLMELAGDELFDNRVHAVVGAGRLIYQRTARLSLSAGGQAFAARRQSSALVGVNGYQANGDAAYRLSRYRTIGVDYSFVHYDYHRIFGSTDAHGVGLNYSVQMGRNWTLGLRAGGYRVEISRLERVPLDPVIAAIIGQSVAISTSYRKLYVPSYSAQLVRSFRRGSVAFHYSRSISPGNGIYLTSEYESGGVSAHYRGSRRASFRAYANGSVRRALVQDIGQYRGYYGGVGMNYRLGQGLSLSTDVGARRYEVRHTQLDRLSYRATVGITFSPGEIPFSLW